MIGYRDLREQVAQLISDRGERMEQLATRMKISPSRLSYILSQGRRATPDALKRIAKALHIDPWDIDEYVIQCSREIIQSHPGILNLIRQVGQNPAAAKTKRLLNSLD